MKKIIKNLLKAKYNKTFNSAEIKQILKDINDKKESNKYVCFIKHILDEYKDLRVFYNYRITEDDIEEITNNMTDENKREFIKGKYKINKRELLVYKKEFIRYFKYELIDKKIKKCYCEKLIDERNKLYLKLNQVFRDFINYKTEYSTRKLKLVNLNKIDIYASYERKLIDFEGTEKISNEKTEISQENVEISNNKIEISNEKVEINNDMTHGECNINLKHKSTCNIKNNQVSIKNDEIPANTIISEFEEFIQLKLNHIQVIISHTALLTNNNFLACTPTGVGKTILGIMAIYKLLQEKPNIKVAFIAPIKSLCLEIFESFNSYFKNLRIYACISDNKLDREHLINFNILVGTPEKIDIIIRNNTIIRFDLLIIDELHIINELRGTYIESIVMRIHSQNMKPYPFSGICRIVGLSATIYNYRDLGKFLKCSDDSIFYFNEAYRPIKIKYQLQMSLNYKLDLLELIREKKGPFLIFVHSRKETYEIADHLLNYTENVNNEITNIKDPTLLNYIKNKIAIHHAGLSKEERQEIESLYRKGTLNILVSTSTLSYGINLPVRTVIVLGTKYYTRNYDSEMQARELTNMNIRQMLGRAGRNIRGKLGIIEDISADNLCYGILLSDKPIDSFFYEETIESQLLSNLHDILLSHISSIRSISEAYKWFTKSYFFIRLQAINPEYKIYALQVLYTCLTDLINYKMINYKYEITNLGRISTKYNINYKKAYEAYTKIQNIMLDGTYLDFLGKYLMDRNEDIEEEIKSNNDIKNKIPCKSEFGRIYNTEIHINDNIQRINKFMLEISLLRKLYVSRLILEYYKGSVQKQDIYQVPLTSPKMSLKYTFISEYLILRIFNLSKMTKYLLLIFNEDKLLVRDVLYLNHVETCKVYRVKQRKYYQIEIISYDIINCKYQVMIYNNKKCQFNRRVIDTKYYRVINDKILINKLYRKTYFLEYYDKINEVLSKLESKEYILYGNDNIIRQGNNTNLSYMILVDNRKVYEYLIAYNIPGLLVGDHMEDNIMKDCHLHILCDKEIFSDDSKVIHYFHKYKISGLEKEEVPTISIKDNMNMKYIINLIYDIPEVVEYFIDKDISEQKCNFYKYIYNEGSLDKDVICLILKYINMMIDMCSTKKYLKSIFNLVFLIQKINKASTKSYTTVVKGNKLLISMEEGRRMMVYIIDNQCTIRKVEVEKEGTCEVEMCPGRYYILTDIYKGYEIIDI